MADDRRSKLRKELAELKSAALAELERRGYDVRGKTPAQIRKMLKQRPFKQKSKAQVGKRECAPAAERPVEVLKRASPGRPAPPATLAQQSPLN